MGSVQSLAARGEVLPRPQVTTANGIVEGRRIESTDCRLCDVFLGIPYAAPPVGERRFRKPEPPAQWEGVRTCRRFGPRSIQATYPWDVIGTPVPSSEDCLLLNVFAPSKQEGKTYPVFVFIHGGAYFIDSAVKYEPRKVCRQLVTKGIVLVTIQYRLGYLGYFCLGNEACKGNFGMWDQLEALRWTQNNIGEFGGDARHVSVGGQSAGGSSTDLLSLSPLAYDLFQQKLLLGGNAFGYWAVLRHSQIVDFCRRKAVALGWKPRKVYKTELEESEALIEFLRTRPASRFHLNVIGMKEFRNEFRLPIGPVIDGEILPEPLVLLRPLAPPRPTLAGVGEHEGLVFLAIALFVIGRPATKGKVWKIFLDAAADKLKTSGKQVMELASSIYGDDHKQYGMYTVLGLSDTFSNYALAQTARLAVHQLPLADTFLYTFDYSSSRIFGFLKPILPFTTGTHCSEIIYLFDCNYFFSPFKLAGADLVMADVTARYFANFIKKGNPNGEDTSALGEWRKLEKTEGDAIDAFSFSTTSRMREKVFGDRIHKMNKFLAANNLTSLYEDTTDSCAMQ